MEVVEVHSILEFMIRVESIIMALIPVVTLIIRRIIVWVQYNQSDGKIKKVLSLRKSGTELILPVHQGLGQINAYSPSGKYIAYDEVLIINEVNKVMYSIFRGKHTLNIKGFVAKRTFLDQSSNHIYFGGFRAHDIVLTMMVKHCGNVKFSMDSERYEKKYRNHAKYKDIYYACEKHKEDEHSVKVDDHTFIYNPTIEGYIILLKLTNKFLKNKGRGTVHICFGPEGYETAIAAKSFNDSRIELYNNLRKRKSHYFAIMKCNKNGEIDFKSFEDLTEKAFRSADHAGYFFY